MAIPSAENVSATATFLTLLFSASEQPVYISSLPNIKDDPNEPPERYLTTRDASRITAFIHKWDRRGRAIYFCVSTIEGQRRSKDAARECCFLFADIDFKNVVEDEATVRAALRSLRYPPSITVRSGNGLHCYWLLKEAHKVQDDRERIEAALRQLADLVAGDLQVCEIARLMRLVGSHNTKGDAWTEVVLEPLMTDNVRYYEMDDLEEWLSETAPICQRKAAIKKSSAAQRETNPFLEHAKSLGWSPPLDVEQALADMTFGNIHATQVSVSASLLSAGREVDEVVDILMDATATAAGDLGTRWNWTRERRAVRGMCETWLTKHPRVSASPPAASREASAPPETSTPIPRRKGGENYSPGTAVVDLNAVRKSRSRKVATTHIALAEALLAVLDDRGEALLFTDAGSYRYANNLWRLQTDATMRAWLDANIQTSATALSMEVNNKLISEARNWIMRHDDLRRDDVPWDAHGQVPTRSGLIHPRTLALTPAAPEHYATWRIDVDYDPEATCPLWQQMLADAFDDREPAVREQHMLLLQDMLGMGLVDRKPKALSLALVIEGASDAGKSGIVNVMAGLFGGCHSTPMDMLSTSHGLMPFARRVPWVLHEAFDQSKWHMSAVVKAIISGEPIQINVKGGPQIERVFTAPIYWATNHPPQFKEATAAITNRIVVINTRRVFDRRHKVGVAALAAVKGFAGPADLVLATELPGLLAWALVGLRRALERGHFALPDESALAAEAIRRDSNVAAGFIVECCERDANSRVSVPDFAAAHSSWWLENKGSDSKVQSSDAIGRAIRALGDRGIAFERDDSRRYYCGLRLNAQGMRHWQNAVGSEAFAFQGKKANTTDMQGDPNSVIPATWSDRPGVIAMRLALRSVIVESVIAEASAPQPPDHKDEPRF